MQFQPGFNTRGILYLSLGRGGGNSGQFLYPVKGYRYSPLPSFYTYSDSSSNRHCPLSFHCSSLPSYVFRDFISAIICLNKILFALYCNKGQTVFYGQGITSLYIQRILITLKKKDFRIYLLLPWDKKT